MKKSYLIALVTIILLLGTVLFIIRNSEQPVLLPESNLENETSPTDESIENPKITQVSEGEIRAAFYSDRYSMKATFPNLPDPQEGYFYEGWIVRKEPYDRISTGVVYKEGVSTNVFGSGRDLTTYNVYLLTLEPRDSNPDPAPTIFESPIEILKGQHAF